MKFKNLFFLLLCGFGPALFAQSPVLGDWNGELEFKKMGVALKIEFQIIELKTNQYRTYLSVPQQGAKNLPMDITAIDGHNVRIESKILGLVFTGKWNSKEDKIIGEFVQNSMNIPLSLERGNLQLLRPQTPKAPFPYITRNIQFSNAAGTCRFFGILNIPKNAPKNATIVLFSGSGAQNRDEEILGHKPFAVLADTFTRLGYHVLRVDDRGAGYTVCKPSELQGYTTQDLIEDGNAYLKFVRDSISAENPIILLGHSEGCSIIAALARENKNVHKLIGFGPVLVSGAEINTYQNLPGVQALLKDSQLTSHYLRLHRAIINLTQTESPLKANPDSLKLAIDRIYAFWTKSTPPRLRRKIEKRFVKNTKMKFPIYLQETYVSLFQNAWMWHFLRSNAIEDWKNVTQEILLLNGSLDKQTPVSLNSDAYRKHLSAHQNIEFRILPGINHLFQEAQTGDVSEYGSIETTIDASVLQAMLEFLQKP